jgi:chromosome segregation ATPase
MTLKNELDRSKREMGTMRESLLSARQSLHSLDQKASDEERTNREMARIREQNVRDRATESTRLNVILVELDEEKSRSREVEDLLAQQVSKLKEVSVNLETLTTQNQDLEISENLMKNEIKMLNTIVEEKNGEIRQLQDMVDEFRVAKLGKRDDSYANMSFGEPEVLGNVIASDLEVKVQQIGQELEEERTAKKTLEEEAVKSLEKAQQHQEEFDILKKEVKNKKEAVQKLEESMTAAKAKIIKLADQLNQKTSEEGRLNMEMVRFQEQNMRDRTTDATQLNTILAEVEEKKANLLQAEDKLMQQKAKLSELSANLESLTTQNQDFEVKVQQIGEELEDERSAKKTLEEEAVKYREKTNMYHEEFILSKKKLQSKEDAVQNLEGSITAAKAKYIKLANQLDQKTSEEGRLNMEMVRLQDQNMHDRVADATQLNTILVEVENKKVNLLQAEDKLMQQDNKLMKLSANLESLTTQNQDFEVKVQLIREELEDERSAKKTLEEDSVKSLKKTNIIQEKFAILKKELQSKEVAITNLKESMTVAKAKYIELANQLNQKTSEEGRLNMEIVRIQEQNMNDRATDSTQLNTILAEVDEKKANLLQAEDKFMQQDAKLRELSANLESLTTENQDFEIKVQQIGEELKDERSAKKSSEEEAVKSLEKTNMYQEEFSILKKELQNKEDAVQKLEESYTSAKAKYIELANQLVQKTSEERRLNIEIVRLQEQNMHKRATDATQLNTILTEVEERKANLLQAEDKLMQQDAKLRELSANQESFTVQNQNLEEEAVKSIKKAKIYQVELDMLKNELMSKDEAVQKLEESVSAAEGKFMELVDQLDKKTSRLERLNKEMERLREQNMSDRETDTTQLNTILAELDHEKSKLRQAETTVVQQAATFKEVSANLESLTTQNHNLKEEATKSLEQAKMHQENINILKNEVKSKEEAVQKLEESITAANGKFMELVDQLDQKASKFERLNKEMERLREQKMCDRETDNTQLNTILAELDHEKSKLKQAENFMVQQAATFKEVSANLESLTTQNQDFEVKVQQIGEELEDERSAKKTSEEEAIKSLEQAKINQEKLDILQNEVKSKEEAIQKLEESMTVTKAKYSEQVDQLKAKYQTKLKEAAGTIQSKYAAKLDECQKDFLAEKEKELSGLTEEKVRPLEKAVEEIQMKYETSKKIIKDKVSELKKAHLEIETLKKKLPPATSPTPKVQLPPPAEPDVFKAPKNTPGRAKPGRTQSGTSCRLVSFNANFYCQPLLSSVYLDCQLILTHFRRSNQAPPPPSSRRRHPVPHGRRTGRALLQLLSL